MEVLGRARAAGRRTRARRLEVLGVGTTGYAKDILKDVLRRRRGAGRDRRAHRVGAALLPRRRRHLRRGRPGHQAHHPEERPGQGLQAQHAVLGRQRLLPAVARPRASASRSRSTPTSPSAPRRCPTFGYGCAVFMQSDIVDFQRQGWTAGGDHGRPGRRAAQEHLAVRLADPEPRRARARTSCCRAARSTTWRRSRRRSTSSSRASRARACSREVIVHEHCGESGAIGAASRRCGSGRTAAQTEFIGLDAVRDITFITHRNEDTRCYFCKNKCLRTFIDVTVEGSDDRRVRAARPRSKIHRPACKRLIVGNSCERGLVEDVESMRDHQEGHGRGKEADPEFRRDRRARPSGAASNPPKVADPPAETRAHRRGQKRAQRARGQARDAAHRHPAGAQPVLGQPAVLGVLREPRCAAAEPRLLDFTTEELYKAGRQARRHRPVLPVEDRHPARAQPAARARRRSRSTSSSSR